MDQEYIDQALVSAVIPAFNEETTIGEIVEILHRNPLVGDVIVVDDGSTDRTAVRAQRAAALVCSLYPNQGKGWAMMKGVELARHEIIFFLDADIKGLTAEMVTQLITPVISGRYEMFVAIRDRKIYLLNMLLHFTPILGGERVLTKALWYRVPNKYKKNFQIEIALNYYVKKWGKKMGFTTMPGLTQVIKEKKRGLVLGIYQRILMMRDLMTVAVELYILGSCRIIGRKLGIPIIVTGKKWVRHLSDRVGSEGRD